MADEVYSIALDSLIRVKTKWRVSIQMILTRLRDIGIISEDRFATSFKDIGIRKLRTSEPLDDIIPVEQPRLLSQAIMMIDQKITTEVLTALPRGYLSSNDWGKVAELKVRRIPSEGSGKDAPIIPLRPRSEN